MRKKKGISMLLAAALLLCNLGAAQPVRAAETGTGSYASAEEDEAEPGIYTNTDPEILPDLEPADDTVTEDDLSMQPMQDAYTAAYPITWTNTGNQARDIIEIAQTQMGYSETWENHTAYNYWYYGQDISAAWCAIFISWCANRAGVSTSVIKKNCVASGYSLKTMGSNSFGCPAYAFSSTTGKMGDIAYIDTGTDGVTNHVGLVSGADENYIYTIEGNVDPEPDSVVANRYLASTGYLVGEDGTISKKVHILFYARPNYSGSTITTPAGATEPGSYKINYASLKYYSRPDVTSVVLGTVSEGTIVEVSEVTEGRFYTGNVVWGLADCNGKPGWICMRYVTPTNAVVDRLSGSTRYETAILNADQILDLRGADSYDTVVVASADSYPDALAGSTLAAKYDAPILLAGSNNSGNKATLAYIQEKLTAGGSVFILGGENAVPQSVEDSLTEAGYSVTRLGGETRYDTNLQIVEASEVSTGSMAFVVNGYGSGNFADALSIAAVAALNGAPIYLASEEGLSEEDIFSMTDIAPSEVYIIGGTAAVSEDVETQLNEAGLICERVFGSDRYNTAVQIAKTFGLTTSKKVVIASGTNFPDGLVAGLLAAEMNSPLLLVGNNKTDAAKNFITSNGVNTIYVSGGAGAVSRTSIANLISR